MIIGLLANSLQEVQEEKVTCDVAIEMRKYGAKVPKDKEFSK